MATITEGIQLRLPKTDIKLLQRLAKRMGWVIEKPTTKKEENVDTLGGWSFATPDLPYNPATDNPSPSNDPYWDVAENRNDVGQQFKEIEEGKVKTYSLTEDARKRLFEV